MPTIDDLCQAVTNKRDAVSAAANPRRIQHTPRASSISECPRQMLLDLTHWQHKTPPDAWLAQRFQRGHEVETIVVRELLGLGFDLTESQMTTEIRDVDNMLLATAHIDGRLRWHGLSPVFECKSLNPNIWHRVNSVQDFERIGSWAKKYPRQLQLYMYACNEPYGVFLLDDCLGHWKALPMRLIDYVDEVPQIMERLRQVVDAKANGWDIEPIDDPTICCECWAFKAGVCAPPMNYRNQVTFIDDGRLEDAFTILRENESASEVYAQADKLVKAHFKARGPGQYMVGSVLVNVKTSPKQGYDVPDEVRHLYRTESEATYTSWEYLV